MPHLNSLLSEVLANPAASFPFVVWVQSVAPTVGVSVQFHTKLRPLFHLSSALRHSLDEELITCIHQTASLLVDHLAAKSNALNHNRHHWEERWHVVPEIRSGAAWEWVVGSKTVVRLMDQVFCSNQGSRMKSSHPSTNRGAALRNSACGSRYELSKELAIIERGKARYAWNVQHPALGGLPGLGRR